MKLDLHSGSRLKLAEAMWPAYYEAVLRLIGSTGTILPIGDPLHGQPDTTSFTSIGAEQLTFTWQAAPDAWATPLDLRKDSSWKGIIPRFVWDGINDFATTPDINYFTRNDGSNEAWSAGIWVNMPDVGRNNTFLSKHDDNVPIQEWYFIVQNDGKLVLRIRDDDQGANTERRSNVGLSANLWQLVVITYDGGGGSSAAAGILQYINGAVRASTGSEAGGYVAMENGTSVFALGTTTATGTPNRIFEGDMGGGPMGPWFTQVVVTADQVRRLYELGRRALTL